MFFTLRALLLSLLLTACALTPNSMNPVVVIEVVIANGSAEEIERSVAIPLERALHMLAGVTAVKSTSADGRCRVEVGYASSPTPEALEQVKTAAMAEWHRFSALASKPVVSVKPSAIP